MRRLASLAVLLAGCNTAAKFDLEAEEVAGVGLVGAQTACSGEGHQATVVLVNQKGGPVRVGRSRLPTWPADAHAAFSFADVEVDGVPTTVTVTAVTVEAWPDDAVYTVVLDRSGAACGEIPPGPWAPRCNATPCGDAGSDCAVGRGCCPEGRVCVARVAGRSFEQVCAAPGDGCGRCRADEACVDGACAPRLFAPLDPEDVLVQRFAATAARLLDTEAGPLSPPVAGVEAFASSGAGLQALSGAAPAADFARLEDTLGRALLPPYGAPAIMENLANLQGEAPVLGWAFRAGDGASLTGRPPHFLVAHDSEVFTDADDRAFARAACETGGAYLRLPTDPRIDVEQLASTWLPAAARAWHRLSLRLDPPPAPGPRRLSGTLRVDVRRLVGGGPRPAVPVVEQTVDLILGDTP